MSFFVRDYSCILYRLEDFLNLFFKLQTEAPQEAAKEQYLVFIMIQGQYKDAICTTKEEVLCSFLLIFRRKLEEFCVKNGDNAHEGALMRLPISLNVENSYIINN